VSDSELQVRHRTVMDDEARHVARVWAEALYKAAEKAGGVESVLEDLEALVGEVFRQDPGLELFFTSAAIGRDRKQQALKAAFEGRATPTFVQFLGVLNEHDRLDMLRPIAQAFRALHDRRARRLPVHVRSAVPLTDDERDRLREDVRAVAHFEPVLQETVDPDILGGLIIRIQDWVYDASVRARLLAVKNQLIERSSHGIQSGRDRFRSRAGDHPVADGDRGP
jgi:F-type H+-transporting ATPase subunit delta